MNGLNGSACLLDTLVVGLIGDCMPAGQFDRRSYRVGIPAGHEEWFLGVCMPECRQMGEGTRYPLIQRNICESEILAEKI